MRKEDRNEEGSGKGEEFENSSGFYKVGFSGAASYLLCHCTRLVITRLAMGSRPVLMIHTQNTVDIVGTTACSCLVRSERYLDINIIIYLFSITNIK